ncbi:MAG: YlbF family regulator [Bacillota bacterium]|nr:YlbF family regulator [Bacillota bacterium]
MNINDIANNLAAAIKSSNEYISLKQAKKVIDTNLELKKKVTEFKQKEQTIITSGMSRKDVEIKLAELNKAFEELSKIPEINNYLMLERQLSITLQNAFTVIKDSIDRDLRSK